MEHHTAEPEGPAIQKKIVGVTDFKKVILPTLFLVSVSVLIAGGFLAFKYAPDLSPVLDVSSEKTLLYKDTVTIGYTFWPGYLGLFTALDKGFFTEEGISVHLKAYPSFSDLSREYAGGTIEGKANIALDAIQESYNGLNHKVVAIIDYSNGGDAIIAKTSLSNFENIRGKKVAYEHGSLGEFFLRYALEQYTMNIEDIEGIDLNAEESVKALERGEVDVAVTYEPFLSEVKARMPVTTIYSSAEAPGVITDILTFRSEFVSAHPDSIKAILRAYFRGIEYSKEHPDEVHAIVAKYLKTTTESMKSQLQAVTVLDKKDNAIAFTFAAGNQSIYGNLRTVGAFVFSRQKENTTPIDTDLLVDPYFVKVLNR